MVRRYVSAQRTFCCFLIAASALAACGGSKSATGSTFPGYCSTGTEVLLFYPQPGSKVIASETHDIYVATNFAIQNQVGLAAITHAGEPLTIYPLEGPVAEPTPTPAVWLAATPTPTPKPTPTPTPTETPKPTPFPTPPWGNSFYYKASGFDLTPGKTYHVEVAIDGSACIPYAIHGAIFSTQGKP